MTNNRICFYCENKAATSIKLGEPICEECNKEEIRTSAPLHRMSEKQKARALKFSLRAFKHAFSEDEK
ncbi:hypothetical protein [Paenibacillus elgii]|uniref:hypothetical protein n=1 Tax=Paenibacillus elgii TaxID=189691 RepID=UPI0013D4AB92|nr:hypothetical protein [Paenibacillus elgii]